jgi:isoleucyl-tRNA synthetase
LPVNVALAVGEKIKYTALRIVGVPELYILATDRVKDVFKDQEIEIVHDDIKGKDLIGLEYEMLYPYLADTISESEKIKLSKAFKIYGANFVTTEDGTGVVHTAVMYGQDDFVLGTKIGLPKHHLVGLDGKFLAGTGIFEGRFVRDENVAVDVIKDLAHRGLLFKKEKYEHSYPHCWRCHTALIYYARDSWYIRMSDKKIKEKMIAENKEINWEPAHIRDGRFGQWLEEIKDWAISRERYWGTPLPVWICDSCKKIEVIGSIADLKNKTKKSGNKYFVMRHGEAENNIEGSIHYKEININAKLTEKGKEQISKSSKNFKEKIDVVFSSPFNRSKETARIVCAQIGFPFEKIIYDKRIQELEPSSIFEGKERAIFKKYYDEDYLYNPNKFLPDGESFTEIIKRVGQFIYELETKYSDKNILIFSHEGAGDALSFVVKGLSLNNLSKEKDSFISLKNAEIRKFDFIPLPHNENYELDLHRPYIDEIKLICGCGNNLTRTKEVMDVWFDSGAMPFAQDHYPFDFAQGKPFENKKLLYPADFISEAIDQTRGWFYTLHAVGILMGRGRAYKNVICLGHLMDAKGKKMSKSVGNIVDPWEAINKYGADTLRLWMYSVNQPGESKNFDEKTVVLLHQQVFGLLYNVLAFYELYKDKEIEEIKTLRFIPHNVLDCWILSQTDTLTALMTSNLDNYKLLEPVRMIRTFIDDLSTWYLQCSRERIKEGDLEAKKSLYLVLKNLAKLMAPFAPFTAEDIWRKLRKEGDLESVHLAEWPEIQFMNDTENTNAYIQMKLLRNIVSLGLEARQKAKIKVRQPLQKLTIGYGSFEQQYIEIMKDKLNVKEITVDKSLDQLSVNIDTNITPELKQEGYFRELVRALQDNRKKMGLTPSDMVSLVFETDEMGKNLIQKFEKDLKKTVLVSEIEFKNNSGEEIKIGELIFKVKIEKI